MERGCSSGSLGSCHDFLPHRLPHNHGVVFFRHFGRGRGGGAAAVTNDGLVVDSLDIMEKLGALAISRGLLLMLGGPFGGRNLCENGQLGQIFRRVIFFCLFIFFVARQAGSPNARMGSTLT